MKRTPVVVFFTLLVLGALAAPAQAVDLITVTSNTFTNNFRQDLKFELQSQSSAGKINQIALFIEINGVSSVARQIPVFTPGQQVQATYEWRLTTDYLPPGVTGQFWWTLEDDAGSKLTTDKQFFRVEDQSKPWRQLSNERFALYWYNGSDALGKALFDRGVQAMEYLQQDIGITVDTQIQTFIYGDRISFMDALQVGAQEWTGGVAFSDYRIILINVEPTRLEWGKGTTTHELTHQVIGQKIRSPLGRLSMPAWMNEGLAEYYEAYPAVVAPQFRKPLSRAIEDDTVPALRTLSGSFPADSAAADLAYAQSYSAVDFIYRRYGKEKMAALLQEFKKGGDYDSIFLRVLGLIVDALDNEWRKDVRLKPRVLPTRASGQHTPFPTFSLSTDDSTPVPPQTPVLAPTPFPTATSTPATTTSVIFVDDFERQCQLWTVNDEDHMSGCENGEYVMVNKKGGYVWRQPYPENYADAVITVEGRAPTGGTGIEYGLALRVSSDPQYYLFTVSPEGKYTLYHYSPTTKWTALIRATSSSAVKTGAETNRLQVIMQGNQLALYANYEFLDTVSDLSLTRGKVALAISSDNDNGKATFDNLTISKINRPLTLPPGKAEPPQAPENICNLQPGQSGILFTNARDFNVLLTIGGGEWGTHDYWFDPKSTTPIQFPPGRYTATLTIPGTGNFRFADDRINFEGGICYPFQTPE